MQKVLDESLAEYEKQMKESYQELTKTSKFNQSKEMKTIDEAVLQKWASDFRKNTDGIIQRFLIFEETETRTAQQIIAPYVERAEKLDAEIHDLETEIERVCHLKQNNYCNKIK